jgi:hypothetical protein
MWTELLAGKYANFVEGIFCTSYGKLNEELHNLYSSPSIIIIIKSRRMRWAGHVAWMGEGTCIGYWWERDH